MAAAPADTLVQAESLAADYTELKETVSSSGAPEPGSELRELQSKEQLAGEVDAAAVADLTAESGGDGGANAMDIESTADENITTAESGARVSANAEAAEGPAAPSSIDAAGAANHLLASNQLRSSGDVSRRMTRDILLHPLSNFSFGQKEPQLEEEISPSSRLERLQQHFKSFGMRRSVEALLVVHVRSHPHILLMQVANTYFRLPGDSLKHGEDEVEGLKVRLNKLLSKPVGTDELGDIVYEGADDWDIGDSVAVWWRPNFESVMYPYRTPHIVHQKEKKSIFFVHLPPQKTLWIPKNLRVLAVPLFEIFENSVRFGTQISSVAVALSRFNFAYHNPQYSEPELVAVCQERNSNQATSKEETLSTAMTSKSSNLVETSA